MTRCIAASSLVFAALACSRTASRKDVTPPLAAEAPAAAAREAALRDPEAGPALTADEQLDHLLARVTFGARPGDRERVARQGIAAFLEDQLHPERLDDHKLEAQLADYPFLQKSSAELAEALTENRNKQRADKEKRDREEQARPGAQAPEASGPLTAVEAAELAAKQAAQLEKARPQAPAPARTEGAAMTDAAMADAAPARPDAAPATPAPSAKQGKKGNGELKRALGRAGRGPGFDFVSELSEVKLARAVSSERQLQEVMADFWFNHFNVFAGKDKEAALLPEYEREDLRPNALGNFRDLLNRTAHSPAMLIYLDNWRSASPQPPAPPRRAGPWFNAPGRKVAAVDPNRKKNNNKRGLNENYARELLELHTMGVGSGYSQQDIIEVARCFTGWTVADPDHAPHFVFRPQLHDDGEKSVLGHFLPAGQGERDGLQVIDLLMAQPATAHFLASKLARRFVSDDPPEALVARVAATFTQTRGDIRSMLRTLFESPEFWSRRALRSKVRSPLELVAGAVRAMGAQPDDMLPLVRAVARIGEPLYGAQPPTGYGDTEQTWISSGALLARIDFGLQLAQNQLEGVKVDLKPLAKDAKGPEEILARALHQLGAPGLSDKTRDYLLAQLREVPAQKPDLLTARAVGLLLGAPELQRR